MKVHHQAQKILRHIVPWLSVNSSAKSSSNYKGCRGRIGIVGGARDYAGAPYFASMSALRLGADLAYVICTKDASYALKNYSPDLIITPLLDSSDETLFKSEMDCLLNRLHALVVGPGLGRETLLQERAKYLINEAKSRSLPIILDADSLLLINEDPKMIESYSKALITPNRVEMQRLLDSLYAPEKHDLRNLRTDAIAELVKRCSRDLNVSILAKGVVDIINDNTSQLQLVVDESSGTSRRCGGQGDIISGLAAVYFYWIESTNKISDDQIDSPALWAAYLAAITMRRSNELACEEFKAGALASHMVDKIHNAFECLLLADTDCNHKLSFEYAGTLSRDEIERYRRQMIMDDFGPTRQTRLKNSSALIIGAGGLGCPVAAYLGAGGIGCLGIVDDDRVESSNLHRQILHNMDRVGMLKSESIKQSINAINPNVRVVTHSVRLDRYNAVNLIEKYDMIVDCTDNLTSRYLINDACVVAKKPLISGAALKMDGQLTVYNYDKDTPCFRCLFPEPPPPNAVGSCSDNGVLGVIPGVIGIQQAFEALKLGAGIRPSYAGKMLLFDGQLGLFRQITLSQRRPDCAACGSSAKLDRNLIDYEEFCGRTCTDESASCNLLQPSERITVDDYKEIMLSRKAHVLVDVRPLEQSDISRLNNSVQLPIKYMMEYRNETFDKLKSMLDRLETKEIYIVCRKGVASQRGARIISEILIENKLVDIVVKDIIGGMTMWAKKIDPDNYSCL